MAAPKKSSARSGAEWHIECVLVTADGRPAERTRFQARYAYSYVEGTQGRNMATLLRGRMHEALKKANL